MVYQAIVSRIKLLSGCNLAEKRRPQDGRIKREQGGREIELRVSTMPTAFGEKAVLRIFDPDVLLKQVESARVFDAELPLFFNFLSRPHGHHPRHRADGQRKDHDAVLRAEDLAKPEVNIVTIEDPIEMVHDEFNQVAVRPEIDVTFANALRTCFGRIPTSSWWARSATPRPPNMRCRRRSPGTSCSRRFTRTTRPRRSRACSTEGAGVPDQLHRAGHPRPAAGARNWTHCAEEYAPTYEEALALNIPFEELSKRRLKKGRGVASLPPDGIQRPRRHLRDPHR